MPEISELIVSNRFSIKANNNKLLFITDNGGPPYLIRMVLLPDGKIGIGDKAAVWAVEGGCGGLVQEEEDGDLGGEGVGY